MNKHQISDFEVRLCASSAVGVTHTETLGAVLCLYHHETIGVAHILIAALVTHDVKDAVFWAS